MAPFLGYKQRIKLITKSNILLEEVAASASMSLDSQPAEPARLRVAISNGAGTVQITGTDENDAAISETISLTDGILEMTSGYLFKTVDVDGIVTSLSGSPLIQITAENDSGEPINVSTIGAPLACSFREMTSGSRIYTALGIFDKMLYFVRLPARYASSITKTSQFYIVGRGTALYEISTPIESVYIFGTNMRTELQFYASEVRPNV